MRVSEVSRALLESYGGTLTCVRLYYGEEQSAARLAALLRRQKKVRYIFVTQQEAVPALSQAIAQGCCLELEQLIMVVEATVTRERMDILAGALEVEGALPAFTDLRVLCSKTTDVTSQLARALLRVLLLISSALGL